MITQFYLLVIGQDLEIFYLSLLLFNFHLLPQGMNPCIIPDEGPSSFLYTYLNETTYSSLA